jgi:hypothetical protein
MAKKYNKYGAGQKNSVSKYQDPSTRKKLNDPLFICLIAGFNGQNIGSVMEWERDEFERDMERYTKEQAGEYVADLLMNEIEKYEMGSIERQSVYHDLASAALKSSSYTKLPLNYGVILDVENDTIRCRIMEDANPDKVFQGFTDTMKENGLIGEKEYEQYWDTYLDQVAPNYPQSSRKKNIPTLKVDVDEKGNVFIPQDLLDNLTTEDMVRLMIQPNKK